MWIKTGEESRRGVEKNRKGHSTSKVFASSTHDSGLDGTFVYSLSRALLHVQSVVLRLEW